MSSIPCAYCKERGHHIKVCPVLEEKNKRLKYNTRNVSSLPPPPTKASKKVERNKFNYLYSSDEEDSDSEKETPQPKLTLQLPVDDYANTVGEDSPYVYEPDTFIYYNKYKGMSWVDIQYCNEDGSAEL